MAPRMFTTLVLVCAAGRAQLPARPEFEVASIKVHGAWNGIMVRRDGGPGTPDPTRIHYGNWSLRMLTSRAYGIKTPYALSTPDWMANEFYTLDATLPPNSTEADLALMLQGLLAERFHLAAHREAREMAGYALVVAKGGIKMRPAEAAKPGARDLGLENLSAGPDGWTALPPGFSRAIIGARHGLQLMTARMEDSDFLREFLEGYLKRPVVDETGLSGRYDFRLEYAREGPPPAVASPESKAGKARADVPDDPGVPLVTAIQQQLGLKVEAKKITMQVVAVDRADKVPTGN
jgi:uncharacterized protein (TIGR03435 family)